MFYKDIYFRICLASCWLHTGNMLQALTLSNSAKKRTTVGQILSLMSVDAQKIQDFFQYTTLIWSLPVMIILAMYFLWQTIGPSCLAGLAVLLILIPLNAMFFARKAMHLQVRTATNKGITFFISHVVN